jgi:hypothetical protein
MGKIYVYFKIVVGILQAEQSDFKAVKFLGIIKKKSCRNSV